MAQINARSDTAADKPMFRSAFKKRRCLILTTDANDLTKEVHNRMPVILAGEAALAWIEPGDDKDKLKELLRPFSPGKLAYHAVNTTVGNVRNNSRDCIEPI